MSDDTVLKGLTELHSNRALEIESESNIWLWLFPRLCETAPVMLIPLAIPMRIRILHFCGLR